MSLRDEIRIMVVDDMSTSRGVISQALDRFGIRNISTAGSGTAALRSMEKQPVHLVISDYNMPDMDGLKLLQKLRTAPRAHSVGFILITGEADDLIRKMGQRFGMNSFLEKPFDLSELQRCIEAVVGRL